MRNNLRYREVLSASFFLFPGILLLICFMLLPVLGTFWNSLFQDIAFLPMKFTGFNNYTSLIENSEFLTSLKFTLLFTMIAVPLELIFGTLIALVLYEQRGLQSLLRVCILIPWAIPTAISARIWELMLNYSFGLINLLGQFSGILEDPVNWLGSGWLAMTSIIVADVWKTTPFVAIIVLAGLANIPAQLYEQARMDGTWFIQRFIYITLPILTPIILIAAIFRVADSLRIFDLIYVLTNGGPGGATTSLSLYGFKFFLVSDFGQGSAVSVILFVIALIISLLFMKWIRFGDSS